MFGIDIHQNMLISLFKTSFDHFQFRPTLGMTSSHYLTVCHTMPLLCSATSAYHQPGQAAKQQQNTSVREFQRSCESLQVPASSSVPCEFLRVPASPCESLRVPASSCEFQCSNKRRREQKTVTTIIQS